MPARVMSPRRTPASLGPAAALAALTLMGSACMPFRASGGRALPQGTFVDDYGDTFRISARVFEQRPAAMYHFVEWHADSQYVIARNDSANASHPGAWTRIDWMTLDSPPYSWAFCFAAWKAPTLAAARAATRPDRSTPRTGCNGYPFSRLQRVPASAVN